MKRVAILISGRGSNMAALVEANRHEKFCDVALVASNRPAADGLEFAQGYGIETLTLDHKSFATREAFDEAFDQELRARAIDNRRPRRLHAHSVRRLRHALARAAH